jgi:Tfp pilus assembly protein PilF
MSFNKKTRAVCVVILVVLAAANVRHANNFRDRLSYWVNAVETSPRSWLTHTGIASIYFEEGSLDKAEQEYVKAIKLERLASPAYAGLGHVYMAKNMPEMAQTQFRKAVAAYPGNYLACVSLGTLYYRQAKPGAAVEMWVNALKYDPANKDALRNMAILCAEQKDYAAARFYVERMREAGFDVPADFSATLKEE